MATVDYPQIFHALGDPTRFRLFQLLVEQPEWCVGQLAESLKISSACVSQHMKILSEAKLVERVREGQRVCYKVSTDTPSNQALSQMIFNQEVSLQGSSLQKESHKL